MTAKNDEYLIEATKTLYNLNADDMVRQRCQARMDAELQEQYLLKKIDTLTADNDKLAAANAAKDAEIEALKKSWQSCSRMHNTGLALVRNVHRWAHHLEKGACIEAPFSM